MLHSLSGAPLTLVSFLVTLTVVVFVHELGHFVIARWCGVRCESFSIGFGPELFGFTDRLGTRWKFSLIPLGGYVKMFGEPETMQAIEGGAVVAGPPTEAGPRPMTDAEKAVSLKYKSVGQRAAIVFAGPAMNFVFAIAVFFAVFLAYGHPIIEPVVGEIVDRSAAADAGLMTGDRVLAINGESVREFEDIWRIEQLNDGGPLKLTINRDGQMLEITAKPRLGAADGSASASEKLPTLGFEPIIEPVVGRLIEGGAAAGAGLKAGDRIVAVNGQPIRQFGDIKRLAQQSDGNPMTLTVVRQGVEIAVVVTPQLVESKDASGKTTKTPTLGFYSPSPAQSVERLGPGAAFKMAVMQLYRGVEATAIGAGQMIAGKRGTDELGGPIRIAQMSGQVAKEGLVSLVGFMAILSINLGLINLFPVPLLDGGHLLFYAIEAVRGRPLSEHAQEWGMRVGLALVGSLFLFAIVNDLVHVVWPAIRL